MKETLWNTITAIKTQAPLVQNITNYVVMNNTANALLAAGASPIMAHGHMEMEAMMSICQALVVNIGTLDEYWVESMKKAASQAKALNKPWVLDPVGAGATPYRDTAVAALLELSPRIIRGNASEIVALAKQQTEATKGVDSTLGSTEALKAAHFLSQHYNCCVSISGAEDIIVKGEQLIKIANGHPMMTKVTGLGCSASALTAACAAVCEDSFIAGAAAMALIGVAGELAVKESKGPGSLQLHLLDQLYTLKKEVFLNTLILHD